VLKGGDMISTGRILMCVVRLCFESGKFELLNENINLLAKRRGQLKGAVVKMVQEVCTYIDQLKSKDDKYTLIETLRAVTEGKVIYIVATADWGGGGRLLPSPLSSCVRAPQTGQ
jgi:26S proteasome regulatory subunit N5